MTAARGGCYARSTVYRILLGLVLLLGACKSAPTTVLLRIEADAALGAPDHVMLELYGSAGWEVRARRLPASGTVTLPSEVVLYPPRSSGTLRVLLRARQDSGDVLGEGSGEVVLKADDQAKLTVIIRPGRLADRDGDGVPDVIDNCPDLANPEQGPCGGADAQTDGPRDGGVDAADAGDGPAVDGRPDGGADIGSVDGSRPDLIVPDGPPPPPPPSLVVTAEGWGLRAPTYPEVHYNAVWGSAKDNVWIVGDEGMALHYDGRQWQALPTGTNDRLLAVWSPGASEAWVAGENRKVWHYVGGVWTSTTLNGPGGNKGVAGIWGSSATDIWIVTGKDGAHHYGGAQWIAYPGEFRLEVADIKGLATNAIWAVGQNGNWEGIGFYDGTLWGQAASTGTWDDLTAVWPVSGSEVWAVGRNGTIVNYDGQQWTSTKLAAPHLNGVWASGPGQVLAVGDAGQIWRRTQQGWVNTKSPTTERLNGVWGSSATDIWAVGENGTVLHFDGQSFAAPPPPLTNVQLEGAWWTPGGELVVVGANGTVLRRGATGSWSKDVTNTGSNLNAIWGAPNGDLWAVGNGGQVIFNDGTGWVSQSSGTNNDLFAISGSGAGNIWAVGGRCVTINLVTTCTGRVSHYTGSASWTSQNLGSKRLRGVCMDAPGDAWAVGDSGVIYRLEGSPPTWSGVASPTNNDLFGVWSDGSTVWAAGGAGTVVKSGMLGFTTQSTPATFDIAAISGSGLLVWAAGRDGQVLHRASSGAWSIAQASPDGLQLRGVLALGAKDVWVVGQNGTVLHFDDR